MTLRDILIFITIGLLIRALSRWAGARAWLLYLISILAVFWLQPLSPVRNLDFWLPTATLALAALGWVVTTPSDQRNWRGNAAALGSLMGVVLLLALTRLVSNDGILTAARPPQVEWVLAVLIVLTLLGAGLARAPLATTASPKGGARVVWVGIGLLIALLVVLKLPPLAEAVSVAIRTRLDQNTAHAVAADLRWLGFSYVAFRLIHTLRDRQSGRAPLVTFQEYLTYALFYPAFTAGPIDRLDRFVKDLRKPLIWNDANELGSAAQRLALGLFKKFIIADGLALVALNAGNAGQITSAGWGWVLLYGYSLQIYFDFSGYTDLAIGLGRLVGIALPENFNAPYLKPNLTQFWNNWHMTLTLWFRSYYFNPLTRALRTLKTQSGQSLSPTIVLFITQLSTMVLIGLWHGVTWNFVLWGVWHGIGLLAQNRFTDWMKPRYARLTERPRLQMTVTVATTLLTFHYVALGWVFFALPDPGLSLQVFGKLFGF
jgi:D-alanyl-lipoteichoic acid acyltransferase DltB (MBOAT superfamily)